MTILERLGILDRHHLSNSTRSAIGEFRAICKDRADVWLPCLSKRVRQRERERERQSASGQKDHTGAVRKSRNLPPLRLSRVKVNMQNRS